MKYIFARHLPRRLRETVSAEQFNPARKDRLLAFLAEILAVDFRFSRIIVARLCVEECHTCDKERQSVKEVVNAMRAACMQGVIPPVPSQCQRLTCR